MVRGKQGFVVLSLDGAMSRLRDWAKATGGYAEFRWGSRRCSWGQEFDWHVELRHSAIPGYRRVFWNGRTEGERGLSIQPGRDDYSVSPLDAARRALRFIADHKIWAKSEPGAVTIPAADHVAEQVASLREHVRAGFRAAGFRARRPL